MSVELGGRRRRAGVGAVVLRRLPRETLVHRLSVGTKLATLAALTVATALNPRWSQIAATAAVAALAVLAARVPRTAVPRLPVWFWVTMLAGFGLSALGHGAGRFLQLVALSTLFVALSAVATWTTSLDEVAPALATFGAPLRRIGIPVDEWAVTTALSVRSLPLLVDEMRVMMAARRLRLPAGPRRVRELPGALVDLSTAAMAVTIRRATDMGEAITARGGGRRLASGRGRFARRDALALVVVVAACILPSVLRA
jgi:energy-coupling factor transport system permease protein